MTNLIPYAAAWAVLAIVVMVLALRRKMISEKEDDSIHLSGDASTVTEQTVTAKKLEAIDKWGKGLTVILVVTGVVLGAIYGLQLWDSSSTAGLR